MMHPHSAIVLMATFLLPHMAHAADPSIELLIEMQNRVRVAAQADGPREVVNEQSATAEARGNEVSQCGQTGQTSFARARATSAAQKLGPVGATVKLRASIFARGGRERVCSQGTAGPRCGLGICDGIIEYDRRADAMAQSHVRIEFRFPREEVPDYMLRISTDAGENDLLFSLKDGKGNEISVARSTDPVLRRIQSGSYFLSMSLTPSAIRLGDKEVDIDQSASVRIELVAVPVIFGKAQQGFIAGGTETSGHPYVGALRLNKLLHCTGTVIGAQTVLTAAHCVRRHMPELEAGKVDFVLGRNIMQYDRGPYEVVGYDYPRGGPTHMDFEYEDTYDAVNRRYVPVKNDIAVVYFKRPIEAVIAATHSTKPPWEDIAGKISLTFVGYGATVDSWGNVTGGGTKREGTWLADSYRSSTFQFQLKEQSTCMGDSGGPAMLPIGPAESAISGVTSAGSSDCKSGLQTRVDVFHPWLAGRIR
jgi:hypothetical protein